MPCLNGHCGPRVLESLTLERLTTAATVPELIGLGAIALAAIAWATA